jgi:hypothetical protein
MSICFFSVANIQIPDNTEKTNQDSKQGLLTTRLYRFLLMDLIFLVKDIMLGFFSVEFLSNLWKDIPDLKTQVG